VDDERPNRLVFEQSFGNRFRIKAVASGTEALEVLKQQDPVAVLVTDQRMPNMTGHELLVRCKAEYPEVVRVVITAYSDLDPILAAINEGLVARYLIKPWKRSELEEILAWGVAAWELGRQDSTLQLRLLRTERLATIGSLAAAILHDLNQPIGNLLINSRRVADLSAAAPIIARWLDQTTAELGEAERAHLAELSGELPDVAGDVVLSCQMLRDITDSLRRFLQPAQLPGVEPSTDPLPIIRYALRVSQHIAVEARARALYDGPPELPRVRMGATELSQVLINVVANAAQALLAAGRDNGKLVVSAREEGDRVRFTVEDNGPGMSPEVLRKVGTPFFSTREEGTGLGISQCRRLLGAVGGQFELSSEEGRGTRVTFSLATAPEEHKNVPPRRRTR
jgi:two-component system, NtrC family, sensor kinase